MSIYVWNKRIKSLFAWGSTEKDYSAMRWPAPEWFHVPLNAERLGVETIMKWLSLNTWDWRRINLHIPYAGARVYDNSGAEDHSNFAALWSSSTVWSSARWVFLSSSEVGTNSMNYRSYGYSIRCFKDSFETPTSSWTVIKWTLWSAWIFWNKSKWLISITSNWTTGYTIQDKNLWATTVYSNWNTLSSANCGYYYQRWNNYGFAWTWSISTSSTLVNASGYGPWNYYSSNKFITLSSGGDRSSVRNDNLWWWVTWMIERQKAAKAVYLWNTKVWESI